MVANRSGLSLRLSLVILSVAALFSTNAFASGDGDLGLADDGREVRLKKDGTWEYVSSDRFATLQNGQRVLLKGDGQWELVEGDSQWVTLPAEALQISIDEVSDGDSSFELKEVAIESVRTKKQKNARLSSQIVMLVEVEAGNELVPNSALIKVQDSKGRIYPVTDVLVKNGSFQILADGSPRWWGVKFMRLGLSAGALGNSEDLELTKSFSEVLRKEVKQLTR